jgi:hypothetical protein
MHLPFRTIPPHALQKPIPANEEVQHQYNNTTQRAKTQNNEASEAIARQARGVAHCSQLQSNGTSHGHARNAPQMNEMNPMNLFKIPRDHASSF